MVGRGVTDGMLNDVIAFGVIPLLAAADTMEMGGTDMGVDCGREREEKMREKERERLTTGFCGAELSVARQIPPSPWSPDVFNSTLATTDAHTGGGCGQ